MIPLIFSSKELELIKASILNISQQVLKKGKFLPEFLIGTMIELPRAAQLQMKLQNRQTFQFGTNDQQTTLGLAGMMPEDFRNLYENNILENDPFVSIDQSGVGTLIELQTKVQRN